MRLGPQIKVVVWRRTFRSTEVLVCLFESYAGCESKGLRGNRGFRVGPSPKLSTTTHEIFMKVWKQSRNRGLFFLFFYKILVFHTYFVGSPNSFLCLVETLVITVLGKKE